MQTWGGTFLYPSIYLMAAALLRSLAENQPFTDGNKRIAWAAAVVFLEINGITVESTVDATVEMMLKVAAKQSDVAEIAEFLETHTLRGSMSP
jgi:death on curing protein